jgi:alpha-D-xyloside xylohydrolase
MRRIPPDLEALNEMPQVGEAPIHNEEISFEQSARGLLIRIPLRDEDVYGFGLQLKSVRQTGKKRTLRVNSDPVTDSGDSHAPVPFFVTTGGWGVLIDTARYATFYVASHAHPGEKLTDDSSDKAKS